MRIHANLHRSVASSKSPEFSKTVFGDAETNGGSVRESNHTLSEKRSKGEMKFNYSI